MADFQTIRISSEKVGTTDRAKIEVDGHRIRGIRSIELTGSYDDVWRCSLEFLPGALDVEVEALVGRAPEIVISGSFVPPSGMAKDGSDLIHPTPPPFTDEERRLLSGGIPDPRVRYLGDVQRLSLGPDDVLVVKVRDAIRDPRERRNILEAIGAAFGGAQKCLVIEPGMEVGVVSKIPPCSDAVALDVTAFDIGNPPEGA